MRHIASYIICILVAICSATAQELNCHVTINTDQIEGTNKDVFTTLSSDLTSFINDTKWTDAVFESRERIECSFQIVLKSGAGDNYSGSITVTASRPVYNSSYSTPLFNFKDENFKFVYREYNKLEFNENEYENNLLSCIAFYVNVVIGLNFDSFGREGGTRYYEKAELIASLARTSDDLGWKAFESDRNRYALITGLLDANLRGMRSVNYEYHRLGLDEMASNVEKGRSKIHEQMAYIKEMNSAKPYSVVIQMFMESKLGELLDMFSNATAKERKDVYDVIQSVLPTQAHKAEGLLK